jgi:tetratricopeptide (TPR) repeat protein
MDRRFKNFFLFPIITLAMLAIFKLRSKAALRNLFDRYPVIDGLFAQVLYEPRFRVLLALAFVIIPAMPFLLFPLIKTSPSGFSPRLRVSGIDLIQAWSLKRTAAHEVKLGNFDRSVFTWRMAIANNPGDANAIRALLRTLSRTERPPSHTDVTVAYSRWLLRLTKTNQPDLELVATMYEQLGLHELIIAAVKERAFPLEGKLALLQLKALFYRGEFQHFSEVWKQARRTITGDAEAVADMYYAAFEGVTGTGENRSHGMRRLHAAAERPELRVEAQRLQLHVSSHTLDPVEYGRSLEGLASSGHATFWNRLEFWNVLLRAGQTNEAIKLSGAAGQHPQEADQAVLLAKFYYEAGEDQEALRVLKHYREQFPDSEALWISQANLLLELKKWDELRGVAVQARAVNSHWPYSTAYAYYFEAVANLKSGMPKEGEANLRKVADYVGPLAQRVELAQRIWALGFPAIVRDLLRIGDNDFGSEKGLEFKYWSLLARICYELQDLEGLEAALVRAHELEPGNEVTANNLAAALVASRRNPILALTLTTKLMKSSRAWPGAYVNHSLALIQNQRADEAAKVLEAISPSEISRGERTAYYIARFEIATFRKEWQQAKEIAALIDPKELLPVELQLFKSKERAVEAFLREKG